MVACGSGTRQRNPSNAGGSSSTPVQASPADVGDVLATVQMVLQSAAMTLSRLLLRVPSNGQSLSLDEKRCSRGSHQR